MNGAFGARIFKARPGASICLCGTEAILPADEFSFTPSRDSEIRFSSSVIFLTSRGAGKVALACRRGQSLSYRLNSRRGSAGRNRNGGSASGLICCIVRC